MKTPTLVYLSGPITDNPDYQADFARAEQTLIDLGFKVMNPAKLDKKGSKPVWEECIIRDLGYVLLCDALALLPGWENSASSRIELMFAIRLKKTIIPLKGSACGVTFRFAMKEKEQDIEWGDEDDLEDIDEKGFLDGGLDDIPGW